MAELMRVGEVGERALWLEGEGWRRCALLVQMS